ncbi:MAG: hypothetical protein H6554_07415 [Chitinophagales bacterium]|nr:hypothetical protein [Chitinophagales bacterium]
MIKKCLLFAFLFLVVFSAKSQSAFDKMLCDFVTTDPTFCNDSTPTPLILDESLFFRIVLFLFYREAQCKAVWFDGTTLTDAGHQIISIISDAPAQGLDARYYHTALLNKLDNLFIAYLSAHQDEMLAYELLITDAAYKYARDIRFGCINPTSLPFRWEISRDNPFLIKPLVEEATNEIIPAF